MKKVFLLFSIVLVGYLLFTGQNVDDIRWSQPPSTVIYRDVNAVRIPVVDNNIVFSVSPRYLNSPTGVTAVNPSVRVLPSTTYAQSEVPLASNKANRNIMFGSSNNVSGSSINSACFVTTDNGTTWGGWQQINSGNANDQRGDPGPAIDKNMRFIFSHLVSSTNFGGVTGMGANYSTNYGANFSSTWMLETNTNVDKNLSGTDDSPTSPYYGNSYTAWCNLASPYYSRFARTTNGGVSWDAMVTLATSTTNLYQGHDVAAGPNGEVYVVCSYETTASPYNALGITFSKSTNGGVNFTTVNSAVTCNGARDNGTFGGWGLRVNDFPRIDVDKSGGTRNGWIYIVNMQKALAPAGTDPDIILYRSSNQGTTWMAGVRVNQDAINNGKNQFFPAVKVDDYGGVNIIYYDNRNFANADSATVMISRSIDGGTTFTDFEITDHHFKPKPANGMSGGYMGDYIGLAIGNNKVFGFWMDDKVGTAGFYNAWTASFDLGPSINHTPLTNTEQTTGSRVVNCTINPAGAGINPSTTKLYYAKNSTTFSNIALTNSSGNNWTANLPLSGAGTYNYYLSTTDSMSRTATAPAGAPGNYYSFNATADTVKPIITHTPILPTPKLSWPTTVTCTVTDNIGVDSSWVNWKKNFNGTAKRFKLTNTSGNNYSALFNSLNSDVVAGDTIFYRIIAQDISANHNRDSTALYNFKIISQATACIGTGTIQMGSASGPFNTYWYGNRTQFLYTASEIIANQGGAGYIAKIGFDIAAVGGQAMTGFNINMQHTALSTLTGFTSTGWTNVYTGTYTVPGTGLQYIDLQVPFNYNGTSNLLVEVCFGNSSYTTATTVNGTTIAGMEYSEYHDISTACTTFNAPTAQTARANTCFVINTLTGTQNTNSSIPTTYSLSQNYPNPFNPVTRINFSVPKQGFVNLKIYDVLGREVKTLVNEVKSPGVYSVDFNGSELSSGVYFYRMESNGFTDIKKMMMIK